MTVLPPDHPYAGADSYPITLCRSEKLILPGFGHDDDAIALFDEFGIEPNISFSTVESFSALQMVEKGLGISGSQCVAMLEYEAIVTLPMRSPFVSAAI